MHICNQLSIVVDSEFAVEIVLVSLDSALRNVEAFSDFLAEETLAGKPRNLKFPRSKFDLRQASGRKIGNLFLELLLHILSGKHYQPVTLKGFLDQNGILLLTEPGTPPV